MRLFSLRVLRQPSACIVILAIFLGVTACAGGEDSPLDTTPPGDVPEFSLIKELSVNSGFGAELRVNNSTNKEQTLALGRWLLSGDHDANFRIYDSSGQIALVRRGGISGPEGFISWLKDRPDVETTYLSGRVDSQLSLSSDMPFGQLKEHAIKLDYEELYLNFDKYSLVTYRQKGGPAPLIFFEGELQSNQALTGLLEEVWTAQLLLQDGNFIVFNHDDSRFVVGDYIQWVGVCEELKSFQTVGSGSVTAPSCFAWNMTR